MQINLPAIFWPSPTHGRREAGRAVRVTRACGDNDHLYKASRSKGEHSASNEVYKHRQRGHGKGRGTLVRDYGAVVHESSH